MTKRRKTRNTTTTEKRGKRTGRGGAAAALAGRGQPTPTHPHDKTPNRALGEGPQKELTELRRRIKAARLPEKETVPDFSQGVPLATVQKLARYWATEYDWRKVEARLNAVPNFITEIDGLDIHFIHVRSKHEMPCRSSSRTAGRAPSSSSSSSSSR